MRALFFLPGVAALAACGPSASGDARERTSTTQCLPGFCTPDAAAADPPGDAGIGIMPLEQWPDETAGQYSGVYAVHAFVTAHISVVTVSFQLLYRLRILQETATNVMQSTDLCAIKLPSVPGLATLTIPPRLDGLITAKSGASPPFRAVH